MKLYFPEVVKTSQDRFAVAVRVRPTGNQEVGKEELFHWRTHFTPRDFYEEPSTQSALLGEVTRQWHQPPQRA